jgi:hypothetical protein
MSTAAKLTKAIASLSGLFPQNVYTANLPGGGSVSIIAVEETAATGASLLGIQRGQNRRVMVGAGSDEAARLEPGAEIVIAGERYRIMDRIEHGGTVAEWSIQKESA